MKKERYRKRWMSRSEEDQDDEDDYEGFKDDYIHETNQIESTTLADQYFVRFRQLKKYHYCVILPDDPWKEKWDFYITFVLVFTIISTPYRIAFYDFDGLEWVIIEILVDLSFLLDMIFNFRAAYFNSQDQLIDDLPTIACTYLKGWFLVDFVAIFPLNHILKSIRSSGSTLNQLARLARLPRLYKILQFSRICKICRKPNSKSKFLNSINQILKVSAACERLLVFAVILIIMCHIVSCMWYFVAKVEENPQSWIYSYPDVTSDSEFYFIGIYFTITTITTVGYGDISAHTTGERILCSILMLIGVVGYSYAIGSLSSLMSTLDAKSAKLKEKLQILENIRKEFKLNFLLYQKMKSAIHFDHTKDQTDKYGLINELPLRLQVELSILVHQQLVSDIHFFKKKPGHFIAMVAPLLKPLSLQRGDYIFYKGDPNDALYFLKRGTVGLVIRKFPSDLVFIRVQEGSYFGDYDFLISGDNEGKRSFTAKALSDVELLLLDKKDLYKVDLEFKSITETLFSNAFSRLSKAERAQRRAEKWYLKHKAKERQVGLHVRALPTPLQSILSEENSLLSSLRSETRKRDARFEPLAKLLRECLPYEESGMGSPFGRSSFQTEDQQLPSDSAIIQQEMYRNDQKNEEGGRSPVSSKIEQTDYEQSPISMAKKPRERYYSQFVSKESFNHKNKIIQDRSYQLNPHTGKLENSMLVLLQKITERVGKIEHQIQKEEREEQEQRGSGQSQKVKLERIDAEDEEECEGGSPRRVSQFKVEHERKKEGEEKIKWGW